VRNGQWSNVIGHPIGVERSQNEKKQRRNLDLYGRSGDDLTVYLSHFAAQGFMLPMAISRVW
jgi:hypothetical protein